MGFNLGLAAAAYQGVKAEQRRIADDEFRKAQRDYELASQEEHASRRGYRDNAAALGDAKVKAATGLLPGETANAQKRQGLEAATIDGQVRDQQYSESQRGTREQTATLKGQAGLMSAETDVEDAEDVRKWSPQKRKLNAQKINVAIAEGALEFDAVKSKVLGKTYAAATTGKVDEDGIIARLNSIADTSLFPALNGREVADIEIKGDVMEARDGRGQVITTFSLQEMKAAHDSMNQGETVTLADGTNMYRKNKDGTVTKLTDNKKSFNPNSGAVGRAGGSGAVLDRFAAALMDEAKAAGKPLSQAEAMRQASAALKVNPRGWAFKLLQNDFEYTSEKDPEKKRAMEDEAVGAMSRLGGGQTASAAEEPGLSAVSPATGAKIKGFIGLK